MIKLDEVPLKDLRGRVEGGCGDSEASVGIEKVEDEIGFLFSGEIDEIESGDEVFS